jgi:hypothetical protein
MTKGKSQSLVEFSPGLVVDEAANQDACRLVIERDGLMAQDVVDRQVTPQVDGWQIYLECMRTSSALGYRVATESEANC